MDLNEEYRNSHKIFEDKTELKKMKNDKNYAAFVKAARREYTLEE
jgi:hypothetical protein